MVGILCIDEGWIIVWRGGGIVYERRESYLAILPYRLALIYWAHSANDLCSLLLYYCFTLEPHITQDYMAYRIGHD